MPLFKAFARSMNADLCGYILAALLTSAAAALYVSVPSIRPCASDQNLMSLLAIWSLECSELDSFRGHVSLNQVRAPGTQT